MSAPIRPTFLIPSVDLPAFRSGDIETIMGLAIARLVRIAKIDGERSEEELTLVDAYGEIAWNASPSMSSAMHDHFWNAVRDVEDFIDYDEITAPTRHAGRTVRRVVSEEERERHFALADLN